MSCRSALPIDFGPADNPDFQGKKPAKKGKGSKSVLRLYLLRLYAAERKGRGLEA